MSPLCPTESNSYVDHHERDASDRAERVHSHILDVVLGLVCAKEEHGVRPSDGRLGNNPKTMRSSMV